MNCIPAWILLLFVWFLRILSYCEEEREREGKRETVRVITYKPHSDLQRVCRPFCAVPLEKKIVAMGRLIFGLCRSFVK